GWARGGMRKEGLGGCSGGGEATTSVGPTVIAVGTAWRPHDSCRADRFGRVRAVAARSAGARSASLDAAKTISDLAATRSQLLTRSPRRRGRAEWAARRGRELVRSPS